MAIEPRIPLQAVLQRFAPKSKVSAKILGLGAVAFSLSLMALGLTTAITPQGIRASDHDDGDIDVRSRALSLTDLYVFRETDQNPAARPGDLVFVMNTNPRSLARQQYFFSEQAQYDFKVAQVANVNSAGMTTPDVTLRFTFGRPDRNMRQTMTLTMIDANGRSRVINRTKTGRPIYTTSLRLANTPTLNQVSVNGTDLTVFAGLREDPFFFDVEQFFRVRAGLAGLGPSVGFRPPATAIDFTTGYNVNSIVVRVPLRLLRNSPNVTAFDTWLSLSIPDPRTGRYSQTEHLARPAVNEGLILSQRNLAAYNRVMPTRNARELPAIAAEAKNTLLALGNSDARANALLGAFVPDVMRIDTAGPSGYANALNTRGAPIRGRMLMDDVIDITLAVLSNGAVTTDNVSYQGQPGNPYQGHDPLEPTFPYLALPN
jgi:Domain of unknown function (DUF4331)